MFKWGNLHWSPVLSFSFASLFRWYRSTILAPHLWPVSRSYKPWGWLREKPTTGRGMAHTHSQPLLPSYSSLSPPLLSFTHLTHTRSHTSKPMHLQVFHWKLTPPHPPIKYTTPTISPCNPHCIFFFFIPFILLQILYHFIVLQISSHSYLWKIYPKSSSCKLYFTSSSCKFYPLHPHANFIPLDLLEIFFHLILL